MAFNKLSQSFTMERQPVTALNRPQGGLWDVYSEKFMQPLQKQAQIVKNKPVNLNGFNIQAAIQKNPDHLFVKVFAIKQDEVNDNGDYFCAEQLIKSAHTFINCPVFVNHQNDDIQKARGRVVHAWYEANVTKDGKGGIFTVNMVDAVAYPKLARGIEQKYVTGSSMGCSVTSSVCSICGNCAQTPDHYCDCIKNRKNRKFSGKAKPLYGQNGIRVAGHSECPVKFAIQSDGLIHHSQQKVFQHNYGIKFIEDSFVVNPACHDCLVHEVLNTTRLSSKFASISKTIQNMKTASTTCVSGSCRKDDVLQKTAGVNELNKLGIALDNLIQVTTSMFAQKDYVSMQYVSDLVKTASELQSTIDELSDMGYGRLPSPTQDQVAKIDGKISGASLNSADNTQPSMTTAPTPQPVPQPAAQPQQAPTAQGLGDGLGTVTLPKTSNTQEISRIIKDSVSNISKQVQNIVSQYKKSTTTNMEHVKMSSKNSQQEQEVKTAAAESKTPDVTIEKQLQSIKAREFGARTDDAPTVTIEKQLDNIPNVNVTTSDSPQKRTDKEIDVVIQKQLEAAKDKQIVRWDEAPEVVIQKQLQAHKSALNKRDAAPEVTIEKQLEQHVGKRDSASDVVIEKQLNETKKVATAATKAIADTISVFGKTAKQIAHVASALTQNGYAAKAAKLVELNAVPSKAQALASQFDRTNTFKIASAVSVADALVFSMAKNLGTVSAADMVDAVHAIASNQAAMKIAIAKSLQTPAPVAAPVSKKASFLNAVLEANRSQTGIYKVHAVADEIGDLSNKVAFRAAALKYASASVAAQVGISLDVELLALDVASAANGQMVVTATVKQSGLMTDDEKKAVQDNKSAGSVIEQDDSDMKAPLVATASRNEKRAELLRQAQMFGGEMGGQAGAAPAAGAPAGQADMGGGAPPVESFSQAPAPEAGAAGQEGEQGSENEPLPPGTICPVCGSHDVDVIGGKCKCNGCTSEFTVKVHIDIVKYPGLLDESKKEKGEQGDVMAGEGVSVDSSMAPAGLPAAGAAPAGAPPAGGMPAAASTKNDKVIRTAFAMYTKITPQIAKKAGAEFGSISPITGTNNTIKLANGEYLCKTSGKAYNVQVVAQKSSKDIYAQWSWNPVPVETSCAHCNSGKKVFASALKSASITEQAFDAMSLKEKNDTILKLTQAKAFKALKEAGKKASILETLKAEGNIKIASKFPMQDCIHEINVRFGQNAIALSGPCEGQSLGQSVCERFKAAGVYNTNAMNKVASVWADKDACEECRQDMVRGGYGMKQASAICEGLKLKFAGMNDMLAQEVGAIPMEQTNPTNDGPDGGPNGGLPADDSHDPFDGGDAVVDALVSLVNALGKGADVTTKLEGHEHSQSPQGLIEDKTDHAMSTIEDGKGLGDDAVSIDVVSPQCNGTPECASAQISIEGGPQAEQGIEEKSSNPVEEKEESVSDKQKQGEPSQESSQIPGVSGVSEEGKTEKTGQESQKKQEAYMYSEANSMRKGYIGKSGEMQINLADVAKSLRQAGKLSVETFQDAAKSQGAADWKGGKIGNEQKFKAEQPKVFSGKATMGHEDADLAKAEKAEVFTGNAKMGEEELDSERTDKATGGDKGAGGELRVASTNDRLADLAKRITAEKVKIANKLNVKLVQEVEAIKPYAKEKIDAKTPSEVGQKKSESETLPQIPTSDARMSGQKQNKQIKPQLDNTITGLTAVAGSDKQVKTAGQQRAIKLAGKLLQNGQISVDELSTKIAEFASSSESSLNLIEKVAFGPKAGLKAASNGGLEQPIVITKTASANDSQVDLKTTIQSMFSGTRQADEAERDENFQTRRLFGRK